MVAATAPKLVSLWFVPLVVMVLVVLVVLLVLLVVLVVPLLVLVVIVLLRPSAYTFFATTVPSTASVEMPTLFTQQLDASHTGIDKLNVESLATPITH